MKISQFIATQPGMIVDWLYGTVQTCEPPSSGVGKDGNPYVMQRMRIADETGGIDCALFAAPEVKIGDAVLMVSDMTEKYGLQGVKRSEYKGDAQIKLTPKSMTFIGADAVTEYGRVAAGGSVSGPPPQAPNQPVPPAHNPPPQHQQAPPPAQATQTQSAPPPATYGPILATPDFMKAFGTHCRVAATLAHKVAAQMQMEDAPHELFATVMIEMQKRNMLLTALPNEHAQTDPAQGADQTQNEIDDDDIPF